MGSADNENKLSRREWAKKTAGTFMILPAGLARGYAANEKLNIGVVGLTGMGGVDAQTFHKLGENIAAICDVDSAILEKRGAEYPKAKKYTDFRKMIEREKLDAVSIATPDHSHAYISIWAMKHGLHVYCQKPLCQTVHEARVMAKVAAETKAITQMGTASTSSASTLRTVELIQSGALGEITEIHVSTDRPVWPQGFDRLAGESPVPGSLDWDLWLGPAPVRPYQAIWPKDHAVYRPENWKKYIYQKDPDLPIYHPFTWRGWVEFGSGAVGDIAPHSMNVIFMALDLGAPSAVEVVETSGMRPEMYPEWSIVRWEWPQRGVHPPLKIYWYDGGKRIPESITGGGRGSLVWIGTKGSLPQAAGRSGARRPNRIRRRRRGIGAARKSIRTGWLPSRRASFRAAIWVTPGRSPRHTSWPMSLCVWGIALNGTRWRFASRTAAKPTSTSTANTGRGGT